MAFFRARVRSFRFAWKGLSHLVRGQQNAWIHLGATVGVVATGLAVGLPTLHWCALVLAMGLVWSAEALNTGLELLCDRLHPEIDPDIGRVKDMAAAGVLLAAVAAAVVGGLVLGPALWVLFQE